jgi:hypothetical protein
MQLIDHLVLLLKFLLAMEVIGHPRHTAGSVPLVIIPADHLDHMSSRHLGKIGINDGEMGIPLIVPGVERLL